MQVEAKKDAQVIVDFFDVSPTAVLLISMNLFVLLTRFFFVDGRIAS